MTTRVDAGDPSGRLEAAFRAAAPRMQGLGFVNPALSVEAVGFASWDGRWLGVMITPWSMNLTLAPLDAAAWQPLAVGAKRRYRFPAGSYEFIGAGHAAAGEYQICSLFSPMDRFADQHGARLVAELAREALLDPANDDPDDDAGQSVTAAGAVAARPRGAPLGAAAQPGPAAEPGALARIEAGLATPLSRRQLLRGILGERRGDRG